MAAAKMRLEDWLDDLCVRFIINLPQEDLSSVPRICFQVEEAQWFYEDFIRPLDPTLPSMSLRTFCLRIFQHCPLLAPFSVENHTRAFEEFLQYKTRVPVRGAILLNKEMNATVLVKGWKKGSNWSFPRGKINKDEDDLDCAIREVYEETGFDIRAAGLVPKSETKYIEISMRDQQLRLYVFRDVPMDTVFMPRTRKEISKIQWYNLSELPAFRKKGKDGQEQNNANAANNANKFYMVAPFLVPLKKWVVQQKKKDAVQAANGTRLAPIPYAEETATEDETLHQKPAATASNSISALDTLEGATLELRRLLHVQPASQGVQVPTSAASPAEDKGASLLALLQAGPNGKSQTPDRRTSQQAHTPLDHATGGTALPPITPHHHSTQHPPMADHTYPAPYFNMPQPGPGPPQQWQQAEERSLPSNQQGNGFYPTAAPPPAALPQNALAYRIQQPPGKAPTLQHPKPLPPQLQKASLDQGLLSYTTPPPHTLLGASVHQMHPHTHSNAPSNLGPNAQSFFQPNTSSMLPSKQHAQYPSSQPKVSLASSKPRGAHGPTHSGQAVEPQPYSYNGYGKPINALAASQPSYLSPTHPNFPMTAPGQNQHAAVARAAAVPTDKHRSTLLDMFKKEDVPHGIQSGQHTSLEGPVPATGGSNSALGNNIPPLQTTQPATLPTYQQTNPVGIENTGAGPAPTSGHTSMMGGESLMKLLRHKDGDGAVVGSATVSGSQGPPTATGNPSSIAFSTPGSVRVRTQATSEQKQTLLSLFGNSEPPANANPMPGPASVGSARKDSVPGSVGSAHKESPKPNHTPISPADRNFLLGYLQSATSQVGR